MVFFLQLAADKTAIFSVRLKKISALFILWQLLWWNLANFHPPQKNFFTELILACISMIIFLSRRHCLLSWPSGCSHLITASPNADVIFISWRISFVLWLLSEDCCKLKRRKYQTSKISLEKRNNVGFYIILHQLSWKKAFMIKMCLDWIHWL